MVVADHSSSDTSLPVAAANVNTPQSLSSTQQQEQHQMQQQHQPDPQQLQDQQGDGARVVRRIAVLECEDADRWKGYTESLWKAALWEEGDEWTIYRVCRGELPTPSQAASFAALLVSGSHYSVYEGLPWISALLEALPRYAATGVRIYGCCFGCQALAQALGGSVGPNPVGNFVLTIEQVSPVEQSLQQFKQLGPVLQAALRATAEGAASPPVHAAGGAAEREDAAAAAAAAANEAMAAAVACSDSSSSDSGSRSSSGNPGAGSNGSSSDGGSVLAQQLSDLTLTCRSSNSDAGGNGSNGSSGSNGSNGSDGNAVGKGSSADSGNACKSGGCFQLIESHGDQVLSLPPGAVLLASSPSARAELWSWGPNVLASQFHLEFDEPLVLDKIWTRLSSIGRLDGQQAAASRARLEAGGQHNVQMLQVIKHFLKHGIQ